MIETLKAYLHKYEWDFEQVEEDVLLTGFVDDDNLSFPIVISLREDLVIMQCTFPTIAGVFTSDPESLHLILYSNYIWPMAKIGLDEEDTIVLSVDLPHYGLTYESFVVGLEILIETAQLLPEEFADLIKKE